jgi:hypothetical protein
LSENEASHFAKVRSKEEVGSRLDEGDTRTQTTQKISASCLTLYACIRSIEAEIGYFLDRSVGEAHIKPQSRNRVIPGRLGGLSPSGRERIYLSSCFEVDMMDSIYLMPCAGKKRQKHRQKPPYLPMG